MSSAQIDATFEYDNSDNEAKWYVCNRFSSVTDDVKTLIDSLIISITIAEEVIYNSFSVSFR